MAIVFRESLARGWDPVLPLEELGNGPGSPLHFIQFKKHYNFSEFLPLSWSGLTSGDEIGLPGPQAFTDSACRSTCGVLTVNKSSPVGKVLTGCAELHRSHRCWVHLHVSRLLRGLLTPNNPSFTSIPTPNPYHRLASWGLIGLGGDSRSFKSCKEYLGLVEACC